MNTLLLILLGMVLCPLVVVAGFFLAFSVFVLLVYLLDRWTRKP